MNRTPTRASGTSGLVRSLSTGAGFGLTGGFGRIYGLALLLLVLLFVMLTFRGRAPRALERVDEGAAKELRDLLAAPSSTRRTSTASARRPAIAG